MFARLRLMSAWPSGSAEKQTSPDVAFVPIATIKAVAVLEIFAPLSLPASGMYSDAEEKILQPLLLHGRWAERHSKRSGTLSQNCAAEHSHRTAQRNTLTELRSGTCHRTAMPLQGSGHQLGMAKRRPPKTQVRAGDNS